MATSAAVSMGDLSKDAIMQGLIAEMHEQKRAKILAAMHHGFSPGPLVLRAFMLEEDRVSIEEFDPDTERMIEELTTSQRAPSRSLGSPKAFLERNSRRIRRIRSVWCRRDYREAHDVVAKLERWFAASRSLSEGHLKYYQECWETLIEQLDARIPWAKKLLDRLEAVELDPPYPPVAPVSEADSSSSQQHPCRHYVDKPEQSKTRRKHAKKKGRKGKHARTKTLVHRGTLTFG